jgi:hypothetical protein
MKPTIVFDSKGIELKLTKIQRSLPQMIDRALIQTAIEGASLIKDRTKSGVSYSGGAFKPYSSRYRLFRIKKGRQASPVNLDFYGTMMGAMAATKVSKGVAKIYFTRGTEAKKAAFNDKMRPFFGFNRQEQGRLQNFFERRIKV